MLLCIFFGFVYMENQKGDQTLPSASFFLVWVATKLGLNWIIDYKMFAKYPTSKTIF